MTLFEECKEALSADFSIVDGQDQKDVIDILNKYPFVSGNVSWSEIEYSDYEGINELLNANYIKNDEVFVFVDDASIPVFRTSLSLIAENIYDVTALSPKLFIFNNEIILQPLFPTEVIRLGIKLDK
ncbi:hypothetical protein [Serratia liquefaciens]|uniref:CDI toxin immunity protein n=1 Tax=Serratia liquefaciens TaxID=614 RepID=UPI002183854D|nr:hypothetical protein [Serratia liquefaciens]CAI2460265.1 Uncharacterised protein [Serratia liquefaciens]